jgi:hypothetical protein
MFKWQICYCLRQIRDNSINRNVLCSLFVIILSHASTTFLLYTLLFTQPHKQKFNTSEKRENRTLHARFKQLYLNNHLELDMFRQTFFFQWPVLSPPRILIFPPESPCTWNTWWWPNTKSCNKSMSFHEVKLL